MAALTFTTVRIADVVVVVTFESRTFQSGHLTRIVRGSDGGYRLLGGALSEPLPDLDAAVALAESKMVSADPATRVMFTWRADLLPHGEHEHPCPLCGAPATFMPRYPNLVCAACREEVTSADGRLVRFRNTDGSGGFEGIYLDDQTPYDSHDCYIRGIRCFAEEARFGGIAIQPLKGSS